LNAALPDRDRRGRRARGVRGRRRAGAGAVRPVTGTPKALVTEEWTPLEPGALDRKLYVRGLGLTAERSVKGGHDHLVLVSFRR